MPSRRMGVLLDAARAAAGRLADQLESDRPFLPFAMALSKDGIHVLTLDMEDENAEVPVDQFDEVLFNFLIDVKAEAAAILDSGDRLRVDPEDELVDRRMERASIAELADAVEVVVIEAWDGNHYMQVQARVGRNGRTVKLSDWETYKVKPDSYYASFLGAALTHAAAGD